MVDKPVVTGELAMARPAEEAVVLGPAPLPRGGVSPVVWPARLVDLALAGATLVALLLTARSLSWPMAHDGPLMHYAAWLIRQGVVPYREIFDMNFPGTYLLHLGALVIFGTSDLGFRLFDLAILTLGSTGLGVAGRSFGPRAGLAAAIGFWVYHLAGGAWQSGQRDFLLTPFLAWGTALLFRAGPGGRSHLQFWAGVLLGFAIWVKPYAVGFLLSALFVLLLADRTMGVRPALEVLAGALVPAVGIVTWLGWGGGLEPFFRVVGTYILPLYAGLGQGEMPGMLRWHAWGGILWVTMALWAGLSFYTAFLHRALDRRHAMLGMGLLYGVAHFLGQGKGWEYHLAPLALFACLGGSSELDRIMVERRRALQVAAVALLSLLASVLGVKGAEALDAPWYAAKRERAVQVAQALATGLRPGDTVQVMDTTEGGIHALLLLGVRQPTRFLYDFHFYHDVGHPTVRLLRQEFLEGLRRGAPAAVVLFRDTWLSSGYARVAEWEELRAWLETGYRVSVEGAGYRIYAKRADP